MHILSSKGDPGAFRSSKRETTVVMAFNFQTEKRAQPAPPVDLLNKLSLASESGSQLHRPRSRPSSIFTKEFKQWETEIKVLGKIKHPNLVNLIGYCNEDSGNESNWLLVYEYMPNKSLDDHLSDRSKAPLLWPVRLKIARDAATGLTYLHEGMGLGVECQIIFRDFKPSNILLDSQMNARLSDFGFARDGPQDGKTHVSTLVVGTKGYAAPEYVQTGRLTSKVDVWSYGIFLEELITGRRPVAQKHSENNPECLRWTCCYAGAGKSKLIADPRLENRYSEKSMQRVTSIAEKCLLKDPKLRPTMGEVLQMVNEAIALENQQSLDGSRT